MGFAPFESSFGGVGGGGGAAGCEGMPARVEATASAEMGGNGSKYSSGAPSGFRPCSIAVRASFTASKKTDGRGGPRPPVSQSMSSGGAVASSSMVEAYRQASLMLRARHSSTFQPGLEGLRSSGALRAGGWTMSVILLFLVLCFLENSRRVTVARGSGNGSPCSPETNGWVARRPFRRCQSTALMLTALQLVRVTPCDLAVSGSGNRLDENTDVFLMRCAVSG